MPDIKIMQQSFLLEWIRKLHTATDTEKWSFIPIAQFSQLGRDLTFFQAKVKWKQFKKEHVNLAPFWEVALKVWTENNTRNREPTVGNSLE